MFGVQDTSVAANLACRTDFLLTLEVFNDEFAMSEVWHRIQIEEYMCAVTRTITVDYD
jgi:hypothetical protein